MVHMNHPHLSPRLRLSWLTVRERTVLIHLMRGLSVDEIAAAEIVGVCTVRSQVRCILQKLGVHSQLAAVAMAHRACWPTDAEHEEVLATVIMAVAS